MIDPAALAPHYSAFRVSERLLLTGHSHQAWPDVGREGVLEAWDDAALHADEKWERAFAKAERVRDGFRALLGEPDAELALDQNTFGLVTRFLSALDFDRRPRLVTSDGEFHTLRRLLARLGEQGLEVVRLPAHPAETLAERLAAEADDHTSAVLVSAVLFGDSRLVPGLRELASACEAVARRAARRRLPRARLRPLRAPLGGDLGRRRRLQVPPARRGQLLPPASAPR